MKNLENLLVRDLILPTQEISAAIFHGLTVGEAASFLKRQNLEEAFVLDEKGHVVGRITQKELFDYLTEGSLNRLACEVMEKTFPSIMDSAPLSKCLDYFAKGSKAIAVLKENCLFSHTIGIDDMRAVLQKELEFLSTDIERLPLEDLDPRTLLKIFKGISDDPYIRFCVTDEKGILRFFNRAYEELTGISRQEAIGKHIAEIFPETRIPHILETGKPEVRYYRSAFEDRYIVSRRIPLKEGEKIIGVLSFTLFRDISEMEDLLQRYSLINNKMEYYKKELESIRLSKYRIEHIVGKSMQVLQLKDLIYKYAQGDSTILIMGESGTGKELVAHAVHQASKRKHHPMIVVNCSSIPKDLLESELFGYEPGSFTGANQKGKPGKFELAHKGTIFLDEVGDLPLDMQAKLLRVLQEREIERIGGRVPIPVDFRLIAATNKCLESLTQKGDFRGDLFYRLAVLTLTVPPLRERREDLPLLTQHILDRLNLKLRRHIRSMNEDAAEIFTRYEWPGNVRELENVLEYAVNNATSDVISVDALPSAFRLSHPSVFFPSKPSRIPLRKAIGEFEKTFLLDALNRSKGNRTQAAVLLHTSRSGLYKLLKKHRIK